MNYRRTFSRINIVALSTVAVNFFIWFGALHMAEAKILLAPRVDYVIDSCCGAIAMGDLDKDRDLDLAVTGGSGVWVLLGNGDGTFQSAVNYDTGAGPGSVAIRDLNRGSHLDLTVDGGVIWQCCWAMEMAPFRISLNTAPLVGLKASPSAI